jgi:hypothetical protein
LVGFSGLLVLLAVLMAFGVAGCGGDGGPLGDKADIVTHAPDITLAAGRARVIVDGPNAGAVGVVDFGTGDADLTVSVAPGRGGPDLTSGRYLSAGGVLYVLPETTKGQPPVRWQRRPAGTPTGLAATGLRFGDPIADINLVRGSVHILSDGGGEVRGASTIRYTVDVDPGQALEVTPSAEQAALRALLGNRTEVFKIDVWIDSRDRIRRVEVPLDLAHRTPVTRPDFLPIADTVDFLGFAPAAPVPPPPPGDISTG